jgi:hypothetical protein
MVGKVLILNLSFERCFRNREEIKNEATPINKNYNSLSFKQEGKEITLIANFEISC